MKAYLLVFETIDVDRETVKRTIDRMPEIKNWHLFFGNTMCLASESNAKALAKKINRVLPTMRYIITEVEPDQKGGRMPASVFSFLSLPTPAEVEPV